MYKRNNERTCSSLKLDPLSGILMTFTISFRYSVCFETNFFGNFPPKKFGKIKKIVQNIDQQVHKYKNTRMYRGAPNIVRSITSRTARSKYHPKHIGTWSTLRFYSLGNPLYLFILVCRFTVTK